MKCKKIINLFNRFNDSLLMEIFEFPRLFPWGLECDTAPLWLNPIPTDGKGAVPGTVLLDGAGETANSRTVSRPFAPGPGQTDPSLSIRAR